jgi:acyl carrier protein phosphodiesterase
MDLLTDLQSALDAYSLHVASGAKRRAWDDVSEKLMTVARELVSLDVDRRNRDMAALHDLLDRFSKSTGRQKADMDAALTELTRSTQGLRRDLEAQRADMAELATLIRKLVA